MPASSHLTWRKPYVTYFAGHARLSADGIAMPERDIPGGRSPRPPNPRGQACRRGCRSLKPGKARAPPCVAGVPATRCEADAISRDPARPGPLRVPLQDCQPAPRRSTRSHGHPIRRIRDDPNRPAPARRNARTGLSKTAEGNLVRVRLPLPAVVSRQSQSVEDFRFSSRCPFRVHFTVRAAPESAARIAHRSRPLGLRNPALESPPRRGSPTPIQGRTAVRDVLIPGSSHVCEFVSFR